MPQSIRRTSTAEAIVKHLVERIRDGEFAPGDRLPSERLLQEELGVGRLSLREGLARLSALGIIRIDHGKGAFVERAASSHSLAHALLPAFKVGDRKALHDLVQSRALIEAEVSGLAAQHRDEADIEILQTILNTPDIKLMNEEELAEVDLAFHMEIARVADNAFLVIMLKALRTHIHDYLVHYVRAMNDPVRVMKRHLPILQAIVDQDVEQARELARAHVVVCTSSLQAYVEGQQNNKK